MTRFRDQCDSEPSQSECSDRNTVKRPRVDFAVAVVKDSGRAQGKREIRDFASDFLSKDPPETGRPRSARSVDNFGFTTFARCSKSNKWTAAQGPSPLTSTRRTTSRSSASSGHDSFLGTTNPSCAVLRCRGVQVFAARLDFLTAAFFLTTCLPSRNNHALTCSATFSNRSSPTAADTSLPCRWPAARAPSPGRSRVDPHLPLSRRQPETEGELELRSLPAQSIGVLIGRPSVIAGKYL